MLSFFTPSHPRVTRMAAAFALVAGLAITTPPALAAEADPITIPSGVYELDLGHASIVWKIGHLGLSNYTARFNKFDATLNLDVENPANSTVNVVIDPRSVDTDYPYADQKDFTLPVTIDAVMNGFLEEHPFAGGVPAIGFSGTAMIQRSAWGMDWGLGNVGDMVEILIEAEFIQAQ